MTVLLDASALLALLNEEKGAEKVADVIHDAAMSAVNAAEVAGKLMDVKWSIEEVESLFANSQIRFVPFDANLALLAGEIRKTTTEHGLSLADRACIATALQEGLPVLTADGLWSKIKLKGLTIRQIR